MLKNLIVLLDDTSVPICHGNNPYTVTNPISLEVLKSTIQYGMEENLSIHFVFPEYQLPESYMQIIDSVKSEKIVPFNSSTRGSIVVYDGLDNFEKEIDNLNVCVLRTIKNDFFTQYEKLFVRLPLISRLNIVITDIDSFTKQDFDKYKIILETIRSHFLESYCNSNLQLNIITDRMMLTEPNHCNSGVEHITIAPNGNFYICPSFYYSNKDDSVGNIFTGLDIKNNHLLRLDNAPLCRICDAYQCKRCVWMNQKTTGEICVPSREQCVISHLERNASKALLFDMKKKGYHGDLDEIDEIEYLDPFDLKTMKK